jgi:hypothetical protein
MWYNSKKLWTLIASVVTLVGTVATGEISVVQALVPFVVLVTGYLGAQGLADFSKNVGQ